MTPYAYRHMQTGPGTIEMAISRHRMAHAAHQQPSLVRATFDLPASCPQPEPHPRYISCVGCTTRMY
jgi:hypothetical protein